jgi:general secretion pathway protein G
MDAHPASQNSDVLARVSKAVARTVRVVLCARPTVQQGMTLLELMLVVAMVAILTAIGYAGYRQFMERMKVSRAIGDISEIQLTIDKYELNRGVLPDSLADVGMGGQLDPWGAPYQYLNIATVMGLGSVRKDRNLVPINTDFDLYSLGPDGNSQPPLTAAASRDDIVRGNDGRFVGKAEDY